MKSSFSNKRRKNENSYEKAIEREHQELIAVVVLLGALQVSASVMGIGGHRTR
jgi:hypothetical protein